MIDGCTYAHLPIFDPIFDQLHNSFTTQIQTYLLRRPREKRVRVATGEAIQIGSGCDGHFGPKTSGSNGGVEAESSSYTLLKANIIVIWILDHYLSMFSLIKIIA